VIKNYIPPSDEYWNGRQSEEKSYWFGNVQLENILRPRADISKSISILGYACDEGVRRNQGRVGAAEGPNFIRNIAGSIAWHLGDRKIFDCGNIVCLEADLETAQMSLAMAVDQLLSAGSFPIVLGGGHDIALGHYKGIHKFLKRTTDSPRIGIINFDAHFDLREVIEKGNSGTAFFQIAKDEKERDGLFRYFTIGIQEEANTVTLFHRADELSVDYILNDDINKGNYNRLDTFINNCDAIYLTVDMDVFASAYAPGVSAPSPLGCTPHDIIRIMKYVFSSGKVVSFDIAECNPLYDQDGRTSCLASRIMAIAAMSFFKLTN